MNKCIFLLLIASIGFLQAQYTSIPSNVFEQNLIDQGIDSDGVINGQVLNSDINTITSLTLTGQIISLQGIEGFTSLEELYVDECEIHFMDLSQNIALKVLSCSNCYIDELDLSQNVNLEVLSCWENYLTQLDLTNNSKLKFLSCMFNDIAYIDLSNKPLLEVVACYSNPITGSLNISDSPNLTDLIIFDTQIESVDTHNNLLLENFICSYANITSLDLTNNINLKRLICNDNNISELNLNNNPLLEILNCKNNNLQTLYLQNGNNSLLTGTHTYFFSGIYQRFNSLGNPNLSCIFVDDATYCATNWVDYDPTSHFVETQEQCNTIGVNENTLINSVKIYPNPVKNKLFIKNDDNIKIKAIKIYSILGKLTLNIKPENNQINLSNLNKGTWFLNIETENKTITKKIVKM